MTSLTYSEHLTYTQLSRKYTKKNYLLFFQDIAISNVNTGGLAYESASAVATLYMKVGEDDGGKYCNNMLSNNIK